MDDEYLFNSGSGSQSYLNFKLQNKFLLEYKDYTETSKYVIKYYLKNIHITINLIILNLIVRVKSTKVLINKKIGQNSPGKSLRCPD